MLKLAFWDKHRRERAGTGLPNVEQLNALGIASQAFSGELNVSRACELHLYANGILHSGRALPTDVRLLSNGYRG
jgi:hypothetical protein